MTPNLKRVYYRNYRYRVTWRSKYRDVEISHSRSLKMVQFESCLVRFPFRMSQQLWPYF